jgi:hypothetical protein
MAMVGLEGLGQLKIKSTLSGIDPANLRVVAVPQQTTLPCAA